MHEQAEGRAILNRAAVLAHVHAAPRVWPQHLHRMHRPRKGSGAERRACDGGSHRAEGGEAHLEQRAGATHALLEARCQLGVQLAVERRGGGDRGGARVARRAIERGRGHARA